MKYRFFTFPANAPEAAQAALNTVEKQFVANGTTSLRSIGSHWRQKASGSRYVSRPAAESLSVAFYGEVTP